MVVESERKRYMSKSSWMFENGQFNCFFDGKITYFSVGDGWKVWKWKTNRPKAVGSTKIPRNSPQGTIEKLEKTNPTAHTIISHPKNNFTSHHNYIDIPTIFLYSILGLEILNFLFSLWKLRKVIKLYNGYRKQNKRIKNCQRADTGRIGGQVRIVQGIYFTNGE